MACVFKSTVWDVFDAAKEFFSRTGDKGPFTALLLIRPYASFCLFNVRSSAEFIDIVQLFYVAAANQLKLHL